MGGQWAELKAALTEYLLKRESWTTTLGLTKQGQKAAPPEKNTTGKKELLTLTPGNVAKGRS
jgi:hypothetical protein